MSKSKLGVNIYTSKVIKGRGRGREIGYPTLNLGIPRNFSVRQGVFAGWVIIDGHQYPGAFHFGPVPTFKIGRAHV